jgi:hypothetical protein
MVKSMRRPGVCRFHRERWPSGLRRTLGKRVYRKVPWVRIPLSPPAVPFPVGRRLDSTGECGALVHKLTHKYQRCPRSRSEAARSLEEVGSVPSFFRLPFLCSVFGGMKWKRIR